jgi:tetratricopeptide (TPR) repeat protein
MARPAFRGQSDPDAPLPSYDLEEVPAAAALAGGARPTIPPPSLREPVTQRLSLLPRGGSGSPTATGEIERALEEALFFTSRGLLEDARSILLDALERVPDHPQALQQLRELEDAAAHQSGTHERTGRTEPPIHDRAIAIATSLGALDELEQATHSTPPSSLSRGADIDIDGVFEKFKEGIRAQVSDADSTTHYDLGVAYREMGLVPDALNQFLIAARDPKLECTCHAMIGMLHLEHGKLDEAAEAYVRALAASSKTVDQELSLYYDLGNVHEMRGANAEALYHFQKIARRDPGFRDVADRIEALQPRSTSAAEVATRRPLQDDDRMEMTFDDLFESK